MLYKHYISCSKFTVTVFTNEKGTIYQAPKIVKQFICQPVKNLLCWSKKFGDFKHVVSDAL